MQKLRVRCVLAYEMHPLHMDGRMDRCKVYMFAFAVYLIKLGGVDLPLDYWQCHCGLPELHGTVQYFRA